MDFSDPTGTQPVPGGVGFGAGGGGGGGGGDFGNVDDYMNPGGPFPGEGPGYGYGFFGQFTFGQTFEPSIGISQGTVGQRGRGPAFVSQTPVIPVFGSVAIYRAVQQAELEDILQFGGFRNPYGLEVKYFSTSEGGAASYAVKAYRAWPEEGPYTAVKSSIPEELIKPEMLPEGGAVDSGIPTVAVPTETLPALEPPEVLPDMPLIVE